MKFQEKSSLQLFSLHTKYMKKVEKINQHYSSANEIKEENNAQIVHKIQFSNLKSGIHL